VFETLRAGLAEAAARDLSFGAAGLGPEVCELAQLADAVQAQYSRFLAAFDAAQGYADEQLTSAAWLRTQTTKSHSRAAAEVTVGRLRDKLPKLAAVFDAGKVSFVHMQAVAAAIRALPEELWAEVDGPLAQVAERSTAKELAEFLRRLVEALTPTPKPRDETQHESRRLSVTQGFDGMTNIVGRVTPEVGEKLSAALSAASRPDVDGEIRLPNQRKADALAHVLDTVLDTALLPAEGGEKPHVTLTVDLDQIREQDQATEPHQPDADTESAADRVAAAVADATGPRPRFAWTGPTSTSTARRLSCDGILLPIFTRGGEPIDVGRRTRIISAAMRGFIVARDQHCRWPGCTMPPRWTQVHHLVHWRDGGRTDRWNLILICETHHKAAHDGRWTIVLEAPGEISVRRRSAAGDPYYEIRATGPPGFDEVSLHGKLAAAARHHAAV
jgi:hypothetical protein